MDDLFQNFHASLGVSGASTVWNFARRSPKVEGEVRQISPPRSDAGEIAERWHEEAAGDR